MQLFVFTSVRSKYFNVKCFKVFFYCTRKDSVFIFNIYFRILSQWYIPGIFSYFLRIFMGLKKLLVNLLRSIPLVSKTSRTTILLLEPSIPCFRAISERFIYNKKNVKNQDIVDSTR